VSEVTPPNPERAGVRAPSPAHVGERRKRELRDVKTGEGRWPGRRAARHRSVRRSHEN
jgi:hypothetical protein